MKICETRRIPGYTGNELESVYYYKDFYEAMRKEGRKPSNLAPNKVCEEVTKYTHTTDEKGNDTTIKEKVLYVPDSISFDIETTSFYTDKNGNQLTNEEVYELLKGDVPEDNPEYQKRACMWIWQVAIQDVVFIGRTWSEFNEFMGYMKNSYKLSYNKRIKIFVHNLAYEFQFMRCHINITDVFAIDKRKPCYCCSNGFEFYCSYMLSGASLSETAKMITDRKIRKMDGDLDYDKLRSPETELDETELLYCVYDVRVVTAYIDMRKHEDGGITKIKLTNTQYVRDDTRDRCLKTSNGRYNKAYFHYMSSLTMTPEIYDKMKKLFAGGFTHASAQNACKHFREKDVLASFDMCSFYPAAMLSAKYPCGKFSKVKINKYDLKKLKRYMQEYACAITITFKGNVKCKTKCDTFISKSKCEVLENETLDNGRVREASLLTITGTEYDVMLWLHTYSYDEAIIEEVHIARKDYLPKPIIEAILYYYEGKTTLKGIEEEVKTYLRLKGRLNSLYGMIVSEVCHALIAYKNGSWSDCDMTDSEMDLYKTKCIEDLNGSKRRFLYYPWGCWVTSICRYRICTCILKMGDDYIYCDTDSLKVKNYKDHMDVIDSYNEFIKKEIEKCLNHYKIPIDKAEPKTKKGVKKFIGLLEFEGEYLEFKALRSKAYIYRSLDTLDDGSKEVRYHLTCAGLNKKDGMKYIEKLSRETGEDPIDLFDYYLTIPKEYSGRKTSTYIDDEIEGDLIDYKGKKGHYHELSFIHMEKTTVSLRDSSHYLDYLLTFRIDVEQ